MARRLSDGDVPYYCRSFPHCEVLHRRMARGRVVAAVHAASQGDGRAVAEEQVFQERILLRLFLVQTPQTFIFRRPFSNRAIESCPQRYRER
jgi:hypothetical protein